MARFGAGPPGIFLATLQGYFLPASLVGMAGYSVDRPRVRAHRTRHYVISLPVVIIAIVLGRLVNRHLADRRFLVYVHVGLVAIGAVLLIQALR